MDDMKKKALKMLKEKMKGKDVKKVSIISDSKKGLEEGLSMAEKLLAKKDAYKNGGMEKDEDEYKLPEGIKKVMSKIAPEEKPYEVPVEIKDKMSELEKAFKNRKKK